MSWFFRRKKKQAQQSVKRKSTGTNNGWTKARKAVSDGKVAYIPDPFATCKELVIDRSTLKPVGEATMDQMIEIEQKFKAAGEMYNCALISASRNDPDATIAYCTRVSAPMGDVQTQHAHALFRKEGPVDFNRIRSVLEQADAYDQINTQLSLCEVQSALGEKIQGFKEEIDGENIEIATRDKEFDTFCMAYHQALSHYRLNEDEKAQEYGRQLQPNVLNQMPLIQADLHWLTL